MKNDEIVKTNKAAEEAEKKTNAELSEEYPTRPSPSKRQRNKKL